MTSTGTSTSTEDSELFHQLDAYPWTSDEEFQNGLRAILGPDPRPEQAEQLTLRARCFYYAREHNVDIDFDAYREWHARQGFPSQTKPNNTIYQSFTVGKEQSPACSSLVISENLKNDDVPPPAPYPLSFDHIVELITSGHPVPGVKEIPNTVLDGQASKAIRSKRRKPWETASSDEAVSGTASTVEGA